MADFHATTASAEVIASEARKKIVSRNRWPTLATPSCVFTKGTFDILHAGHLALIAYCARQAHGHGRDTRVVVAVESDASVRRRKGPQRPYQSEAQRALQIALLSDVDAVVIAEQNELAAVLRDINPALYVKGMDTANAAEAQHVDGLALTQGSSANVEFQALPPSCRIVVFTDDGTLSTSLLVDRIVSMRKERP